LIISGILPAPDTRRDELPTIYWLVIEGEHPELSFNDPGRDVALS
jgi:hypothetical protein